MITPERASEAVQRLINSHFNNDRRARCSIPANQDDDDLVASRFVKQYAALLASHARLEAENAQLRSQVAALSSPVTDAEWTELLQCSNTGYSKRRYINLFIAARMKEQQ